MQATSEDARRERMVFRMRILFALIGYCFDALARSIVAVGLALAKRPSCTGCYLKKAQSDMTYPKLGLRGRTRAGGAAPRARRRLHC